MLPFLYKFQISSTLLYVVLAYFGNKNFSRLIQHERSPNNFKVTFGENSNEISSGYYNQNHEIPNLKTLPVDHNIQIKS